jgi:transcription factor SFP1
MEAAFMRDFSCCGITLDSLHELLQHFEEAHAQSSKETLQRISETNRGGMMSNEGSSVAPVNAAAVQQQAQQQHAANQQQGFRNQNAQSPAQNYRHQQMGSDGFNKTSLSTVQDVDELEDMEMDDAQDAPTPQQQFSQSQFGQPGSRNSLNLNMSGMQHGLRTSAPTTPMASQSGFQFQNNPTVSSVNTPALSTQSMQLGSSRTPDSSVPGTPAELDPDFTGNFMGRLPGQTSMSQNIGMEWSGLGNLTIDEPAKRLISKGGGMNSQQLQAALAQGQFGNNAELIRKLQEQQLLNGGTLNALGFPEEVKPFKCPVIGCEKAYKNQNGLKYHKSVCFHSRLPRLNCVQAY